MMMRGGLRALLASMMLAQPASAAAQDPDFLGRPAVRDVTKEGEYTGCELSLLLAEGPQQPVASIALSFTVMYTTPGQPLLMLKVGYAAAGATKPQAPSGAFLVTDGGDNRTDVSRTWNSAESPGFVLVGIEDSPRSREAMADIAAGTLRVSVSVEGHGTRVWYADLTPEPAIIEQWNACMEKAQA